MISTLTPDELSGIAQMVREDAQRRNLTGEELEAFLLARIPRLLDEAVPGVYHDSAIQCDPRTLDPWFVSPFSPSNKRNWYKSWVDGLVEATSNPALSEEEIERINDEWHELHPLKNIMIEDGVADSPEQIVERINQSEGVENIRHIVFAGWEYRDAQPERDGWRWHKWGEYIGEHEPKHEYLYDEDIEKVLVFTVLELRD